MSTTALVSVEEYLRMTAKPYREYRNGVLYPKARPTKLHSLIQKALILLLERQGAQAFPELTVRLTPEKYFVPDLAVSDDFTGDYPTEPVRLCCEILSPGDRIGTAFAKCDEYHAWGVRFCWIIDPEKRSAWEYHSGLEPVHATDTLHAGEIVISLADLFASLPS